MDILSEIIASKKKRISNQGYRPLARMREHARAVRSVAEAHVLVRPCVTNALTLLPSSSEGLPPRVLFVMMLALSQWRVITSLEAQRQSLY